MFDSNIYFSYIVVKNGGAKSEKEIFHILHGKGNECKIPLSSQSLIEVYIDKENKNAHSVIVFCCCLFLCIGIIGFANSYDNYIEVINLFFGSTMLYSGFVGLNKLKTVMRRNKK